MPPSHNEDFSVLLNTTIWILAGVSGLFLGLRLWAKTHRGKKLWWDDYFLTASWVALLLGCALQSADVRIAQFGKTQGLDSIQARLISTTAGFFLILATLWSKTSFTLTLLRITQSGCWLHRAVWAVAISINLAIGLSLLIQWFWCWPSEKIWNRDVKGQCLPRRVVHGYNIFAAVYSGVMDIMLAMLPWKVIWSLSMNRREKCGVAFAMSMGVL
ncbi:hypothetical protein B0H63DRAFT_387575 [Podospora didyma]|uniref:Rhodopsin domain-containing protein n=1 Tax=Podospora didyma TaxID=330526 RepID=A0AAE0P8G4_9PEZI|nr:hypothetical protein B0H63DRAFT_387575 [Podospora didyma]